MELTVVIVKMMNYTARDQSCSYCSFAIIAISIAVRLMPKCAVLRSNAFGNNNYRQTYSQQQTVGLRI